MDFHIDKKVGVLLAIALLIGGAIGFTSGVAAVGERFEHNERGMRFDQREDERGERQEAKNKYNDNDTETIQIAPTQQNTSTSSNVSEENIKTDTATSGAVVGN